MGSVAGTRLLEGAPAFRDLGGLPTADGERRVRSGLLYRSCALIELSPADVRSFAELGIRTVVDLRDRDEVSEESDLAWLGTGTELRQLPLVDLMLVGDAKTEPELVPELPLVARYLQFVEHGAPGLTELMSLFGDPQRLPLVFHCTAGKDRTGLVTAVLLELLGVSPAVIAAEYGAARSEAEWLRGFLARRKVQSRKVGTLDPRLLDADPETIATLLRIVAERHGGFRSLLLERGADPEAIDRLRRTLLEPVPA